MNVISTKNFVLYFGEKSIMFPKNTVVGQSKTIFKSTFGNFDPMSHFLSQLHGVTHIQKCILTFGSLFIADNILKVATVTISS